MTNGILLSLLGLALIGGCVQADELLLRAGDLEATFDETTGYINQVRYKGDVLLDAKGQSSLSFGLGGPEGAQQKWMENFGPRKVLKVDRPADGKLEITVRIGDYELVERYTMLAGSPRIDRAVTLTNRGAERVTLRSFVFHTKGIAAKGDGFYRFPHCWAAQSYKFSALKEGVHHSGRWGGIAPLVVQLKPDRSLLFLSFTSDPAGVGVNERTGQLHVSQNVTAQGYLKPNVAQEIGFVSMLIADADYWGSLPTIWKWMDSVGLKVPADRPRWIEEAILYSFHPGGTIGSNFKDLGGFKVATDKLLPSIAKLGATSIWIMPIEQKSPYWPFDYYKFMDGLGTGDEYKALVAKAHELKLHVLQDLVPHGGSPKAVHNVAHPEFMLRREDGSHLDYWLNDFNLPAWQEFIAGVTRHYIKEYGIDGYRIDACGGSKEANWNPDIPYARASHALLQGGLGMVGAIRKAVRETAPKDGAVLAEVENERLLAVSDVQYDFGFCYNVCHEWRRRPAAEYVALLRDYLEEQKYCSPRGALHLRHVESHDSLRGELWYGAKGMEALYALSAWIDGVPLIYHEMEVGHSDAIRAINRARLERPEVARGETLFRAVECDQSCVFTCLRKLENRASVVAINFGTEEVKANLKWSYVVEHDFGTEDLRLRRMSQGGSATLTLKPLEYVILPRAGESGGPAAVKIANATPAASDMIAFPDAQEWFVDTFSGRLSDTFLPRHAAKYFSGIYWRPQGTEVLWQNELLPLHPGTPRLGAKGKGGTWTIVEFDGPVPENVRLVESWQGKAGLQLVGLGALRPKVGIAASCPPPPGDAPVALGGVQVRCVGPDFILSNAHYTVTISRQGGAIREMRTKDRVLFARMNLYGDQEYFKCGDSDSISIADDAESGLAMRVDADGLHMTFMGQLRGFQRFALKRPPILYTNEYVFSDKPVFQFKHGLKAQKSFAGKKGFLSTICQMPEAGSFRCVSNGAALTEGSFGDGSGSRQGETKGKVPARVEFLREGKPILRMGQLAVSGWPAVNVFAHGTQFFVTFLEGEAIGMDEKVPYELRGQWEVVR